MISVFIDQSVQSDTWRLAHQFSPKGATASRSGENASHDCNVSRFNPPFSPKGATASRSGESASHHLLKSEWNAFQKTLLFAPSPLFHSALPKSTRVFSTVENLPFAVTRARRFSYSIVPYGRTVSPCGITTYALKLDRDQSPSSLPVPKNPVMRSEFRVPANRSVASWTSNRKLIL